jgi:hypothetical protein
MATQIQFRRGTKSQHNSFTGATGEVTVDTTNLSLHVHDGVTPGGFESAKVDLSNHSGVGVLTATTFSGNLTGNVTGTNGNFTGIVTASAFLGDGSGLTGVGIGSTGSIDTVGIITASAFFGDGSGLTGAGSTVFNDTTTNQEFFPLFTDITTGTVTASGISTSKLTYNPSTGTLTATDFNSTSDINLKENIRPIEDPLNKVLQLNGVEFDWKDNQQSSIGVIAQELEKVFPSLVKTAENKSVNYNGLIGVLVEAVKEQQKQIEELKKLIQDR